MSNQRNGFLVKYGHEGHLSEIFESGDRFMRGDVAKNPTITKSLLNSALDDPHYHVRNSALDNPNIESKHITKALGDSDVFVREKAIHHINANKSHMLIASNDEDDRISEYAKERLGKHNE